MIHSELNFAYSVKQKSKFICLHGDIQLSQHHPLKTRSPPSRHSCHTETPEIKPHLYGWTRWVKNFLLTVPTHSLVLYFHSSMYKFYYHLIHLLICFLNVSPIPMHTSQGTLRLVYCWLLVIPRRHLKITYAMAQNKMWQMFILQWRLLLWLNCS